jgi:hypothetical protein
VDTGSREENASKQEDGAPFQFHQNGRWLSQHRKKGESPAWGERGFLEGSEGGQPALHISKTLEPPFAFKSKSRINREWLMATERSAAWMSDSVAMPYLQNLNRLREFD